MNNNRNNVNKSSNSKREAMKPMRTNGKGSKSHNSDSNRKFNQIQKTSASNDPDWYFTSKDLAEQVATFPFPYFLGKRPVIGAIDVPSILVTWLNPSCGVSSTTDIGGFNMAIQKIYTRLSTASGRPAEYQPNDVGHIILATTEVGSLIEYARRFFGIAMTYNARNRNFAARMIGYLAYAGNDQTDAMDTDFGHDFIANMADYRMHLNSLIQKFNQVPLFGDIGYVRKSFEIYQKIYVDAPVDTAQMYALAPYSTWIIDETGETGTVLRTLDVAQTLKTEKKFSALLDIINQMVTALLNSSTLNKVYADIFNYQAKFSTNFIKLDYVLEGYSVIPEYSSRFLQQIHNANALGAPFVTPEGGTQAEGTTNSNDVISDVNTGLVVYNPVFPNIFVGAFGSNNLETYFDFITSTPTLEDKIDNIMFKIGIPKKSADTATTSNRKGCEAILPDHYPVFFTMYGSSSMARISFINSGMDVDQKVEIGSEGNYFDSTSVAGALDVTRLGALISAFELHPLMIKYAGSGTSAMTKASKIIGSLAYPTTIDRVHHGLMMNLIYQGLFELR